MTDEAKKVLQYIKCSASGRQEAKTQHNIAAHMNLHKDRIRDLVRELRVLGWPIYSSSSGTDGGYYLPGPGDRDECQHSLRELYSRINKLVQRARPLYADFKKRYHTNIPELDEVVAEQSTFF